MVYTELTQRIVDLETRLAKQKLYDDIKSFGYPFVFPDEEGDRTGDILKDTWCIDREELEKLMKKHSLTNNSNKGKDVNKR